MDLRPNACAGPPLSKDEARRFPSRPCASCHFHAGADARINNALSPGLFELPDSDTAFGATVAVPPFSLGATASGGNDVVSSAGAVDATFSRIRPIGPFDRCDEVSGNVFHAGAFAARQVEPRNTPTMVNAVFNHRNFWDGRAMCSARQAS